MPFICSDSPPSVLSKPCSCGSGKAFRLCHAAANPSLVDRRLLDTFRYFQPDDPIEVMNVISWGGTDARLEPISRFLALDVQNLVLVIGRTAPKFILGPHHQAGIASIHPTTQPHSWFDYEYSTIMRGPARVSEDSAIRALQTNIKYLLAIKTFATSSPTPTSSEQALDITAPISDFNSDNPQGSLDDIANNPLAELLNGSVPEVDRTTKPHHTAIGIRTYTPGQIQVNIPMLIKCRSLPT